MYLIWSKPQGTASTAQDMDLALGKFCKIRLFSIYLWTIIDTW